MLSRSLVASAPSEPVEDEYTSAVYPKCGAQNRLHVKEILGARRSCVPRFVKAVGAGIPHVASVYDSFTSFSTLVPIPCFLLKPGTCHNIIKKVEYP